MTCTFAEKFGNIFSIKIAHFALNLKQAAFHKLCGFLPRELSCSPEYDKNRLKLTNVRKPYFEGHFSGNLVTFAVDLAMTRIFLKSPDFCALYLNHTNNKIPEQSHKQTTVL